MNKKFFQPVMMESQFVDTKLFNVMLEDDTGTRIVAEDGMIVTLGNFIPDEIYSRAWTRAGSAGTAPKGMTVRKAKLTKVATAMNVCALDVVTMPTASGFGNTYRQGVKTIGLKAEPNVQVRARKLVVDDVFVTSSENCDGLLVVDQYAVLGGTGKEGKWVASTTLPATDGTICQVVDKYVISQGVDGDVNKNGVTAYRLLVIKN